MNEKSDHESAVELLQQLGLKEYEARTFVALTRLPHGTARNISDISDVPRTRVYDAIRVLESKGLVETQHTTPKEFRTVPVEEAIDTLRAEYENRTQTLRTTLANLETETNTDNNTESTHEVWSLSGRKAIESRTLKLIDASESEIVLVVGSKDVLTGEFYEHIQQALQRSVSVLIGTLTEDIKLEVDSSLPEAEVFTSGLTCIQASAPDDERTKITRILLVDQESILLSTVNPRANEERNSEHAVYGRGVNNGLVTVARRVLAAGLPTEEDPGLRD